MIQSYIIFGKVIFYKGLPNGLLMISLHIFYLCNSYQLVLVNYKNLRIDVWKSIYFDEGLMWIICKEIDSLQQTLII